MGDRSVMWFRRDLRLADNPALMSAIAGADDGVVPLFVVDDRLWKRSGVPRLAYLCDSLRSLRERIGGIVIRHGDPAEEVPEVAQSVGAVSVHIADDFGPYGSDRDAREIRGIDAAAETDEHGPVFTKPVRESRLELAIVASGRFRSRLEIREGVRHLERNLVQRGRPRIGNEHAFIFA